MTRFLSKQPVLQLWQSNTPLKECWHVFTICGDPYFKIVCAPFIRGIILICWLGLSSHSLRFYFPFPHVLILHTFCKIKWLCEWWMCELVSDSSIGSVRFPWLAPPYGSILCLWLCIVSLLSLIFCLSLGWVFSSSKVSSV
jgi:hypothetical protein